MEALEKKVVDKLKSLKKQYQQDDQAIEFEKTNKKFDELVKKGYIKKRGNNLLSPADAHIKNRVWFNAE